MPIDLMWHTRKGIYEYGALRLIDVLRTALRRHGSAAGLTTALCGARGMSNRCARAAREHGHRNMPRHGQPVSIDLQAARAVSLRWNRSVASRLHPSSPAGTCCRWSCSSGKSILSSHCISELPPPFARCAPRWAGQRRPGSWPKLLFASQEQSCRDASRPRVLTPAAAWTGPRPWQPGQGGRHCRQCRPAGARPRAAAAAGGGRAGAGGPAAAAGIGGRAQAAAAGQRCFRHRPPIAWV